MEGVLLAGLGVTMPGGVRSSYNLVGITPSNRNIIAIG